MPRTYTDLSIVPISVAPAPATSGISLGVTDANALLLPDIYPWYGVAKPSGSAPTRLNSEIVKVTGASSSGGTTTYTIVRSQGIPVTTARTIIVGDDFYQANSAEFQTSGSFIIGETPTGTVNGSNAIFTCANAYVAGSLIVYRDGQRMKSGGADYTETTPASGIFTFITAPVSGSVIYVDYQKVVATFGNADTLDGYHANPTPTANNIPVLDANALLPTAALSKAIGSDVNTGTDPNKAVTSKAIRDSNLWLQFQVFN